MARNPQPGAPNPPAAHLHVDLAWSSVRPDLLRQPICHQLLRHWLLSLQPELAPRQQSRAYSLGVTITDDATMAALNQTWRHGPGATDVLAFTSGQDGHWLAPGPGEPLELGDIVITWETAERQAGASGWSVAQELVWLLSHGLLHLLGWDHPDDASLAAMLERQILLLEATGQTTIQDRAKVWPLPGNPFANHQST
ncbi:MAG: rRNA maturation RNase YbeY [Synechococcus sp. SB0665_bin_28]|nr:rRNA maturation RNase YbeY [Synechococcus sp. SB0665_bin_28]MYF19152.1 rRNA maturation RNase YbeY [Synechococcus sp. SB0677_bin_5]